MKRIGILIPFAEQNDRRRHRLDFVGNALGRLGSDFTMPHPLQFETQHFGLSHRFRQAACEAGIGADLFALPRHQVGERRDAVRQLLAHTSADTDRPDGGEHQ